MKNNRTKTIMDLLESIKQTLVETRKNEGSLVTGMEQDGTLIVDTIRTLSVEEVEHMIQHINSIKELTLRENETVDKFFEKLDEFIQEQRKEPIIFPKIPQEPVYGEPWMEPNKIYCSNNNEPFQMSFHEYTNR